jgi:hypothetical protein
MKLWPAVGVIGFVAILAGARAEAPFSQAIQPADFAAAELGKLSPAALQRLDELVQAYKSGAVAAARADAEAKAAQVAAMAREQEKAREKETSKAASSGFFAKAKVLLSPGTQVEFGEIESRIDGEFTGWEGHTIFTLENGSRWRVANSGGYYSPAVSHPKVKVFPAALGGFWLRIEGVNPRVKVMPVEQ